MSMYIVSNGEKQKVNISATDVQLLDIENKFESKNLEDVVKQLTKGSAFDIGNKLEYLEYLSSSSTPSTTTFNSDNSITKTYTNGVIVKTVFNSDGSIVETLTIDKKTITKTTVFNSDGSISEVIE